MLPRYAVICFSFPHFMILTFFSYSSNSSLVKPLYQQTTILIDNSKTTFKFFCSCLQILLDMTVANPSLLPASVLNKSTKNYVCFLLSTRANVESSFLNKCQRIIDLNDISFTEKLFGKKTPYYSMF